MSYRSAWMTAKQWPVGPLSVISPPKTPVCFRPQLINQISNIKFVIPCLPFVWFLLNLTFYSHHICNISQVLTFKWRNFAARKIPIFLQSLFLLDVWWNIHFAKWYKARKRFVRLEWNCPNCFPLRTGLKENVHEFFKTILKILLSQRIHNV